jgi:peptide chain release factor subunit 1
MAIAVTPDILRELAAFEAANGCALSIYLDFDPSSTPTAPDVDAKFNAVLNDAEKVAEARASGRECRLAVREDVERIRTWWEDEFDRDGSRGVAVFASSADDFFRAVPLAGGVADAIEVSGELYLTPLAGLLGRGDGALVVVVSRERGTVYRLVDGRLVEVVEESDDIPGRHDQGGWSQARYQRHIEKLVKDHLKQLGDAVDKRARGANGLVIVAVGPEELRSEFEEELSVEARERVVGWVVAESHAGPVQLLELVTPILDEVRARREEAAVERFAEERGRRGRAAGGWKQTLAAASDGRVEVLLLEEGVQRAAWRCPQCGRAYADGGRCPLDETKLAPRDDGSDLAIHQTLLHGGTVLRVGRGALAGADGIGALLRF